MIGNDKVYCAVAQSFPKLFSILALANWWAAFEFSGAVGNVFGREMQIMRTGFDGERQSRRFRLAQDLQSVRRRVMHDVNATAGFPRQLDHQRDSLIFCLARTRS